MANIFVRGTTGSNANTGADWNNAKQTVAGGLAVAATNDIIYVDNGESFTANAAITWTPVTSGNVSIISALRSGTSGATPATGAAESVGAASSAFTINGAVSAGVYIFGMAINGGTNNSAVAVINVQNNSDQNSRVSF